MFSVIKKKHNTFQSLRDMTLFGKKFTAKEALDCKIIDQIYKLEIAVE
jgi:hypothetical protein